MSRIISGVARGRRLVTPSGSSTRPTTDRVREGLFSRLASWAGTAAGPVEESLSGIAFLDLYAGSGAVGLEAASRGAAPVWLVESDRRAAQVAQQNVTATGLVARVVTASVEQLLAGPATPFDVVWADPPYDLPTADLDRLVRRLTQGWLAPDALVAIERAGRTEPPDWPDGFDAWEGRYGETTIFFAQ